MEMSGSDAGTKVSLPCGHNHVSGGRSFLVWQVHRIRGARIPLAFERRQAPFDCPDDVDQLLQCVCRFWRKLALIPNRLYRSFGSL
jgi:hypothetical protein